MDQPVDTITVQHARTPIKVDVFTSAPHVIQFLLKHVPAQKFRFCMDIDDTVLHKSKPRPLGFTLTQELIRRGGEPIFVTAREGSTSRTDSGWRDTFFSLYEAGLHPTVTDKRNTVVLFKPPPNYGRMSESAKDCAVETFKESQRRAAKPLFLACGDCLWDGIPTMGDGNKWVMDNVLKHRAFNRAYFIFSSPEAGKLIPGGVHAQFFLLLPNKFSKRLLETTGLVSKTVDLLNAQSSKEVSGRF
jgi:hypothetical protein